MDKLISYLKVEINRVEDIIASDYVDIMSDNDYYYEQGRIEAYTYILNRLEDINKEENL